jgi:hypothetical protein
MATVSSISARAKARSTTAAAPAAQDEYAGLYINPGIWVGTEDDPKFVRFPRGVAVSDLFERKLYEKMDPEFAAEQDLLNQRIARIKAKALTLDEGEYVVLNIPVVLYRKQEAVEMAPVAKPDATAIDEELFG